MDGKRVFIGGDLECRWFYGSERLEGWSEVTHAPPGGIWGWCEMFQVFPIGAASSDSVVTFPD